jgi:hypothetical protein
MCLAVGILVSQLGKIAERRRSQNTVSETFMWYQTSFQEKILHADQVSAVQ